MRILLIFLSFSMFFILFSCGDSAERGEQLEYQTTDTEPGEDSASVSINEDEQN